MLFYRNTKPCCEYCRHSAALGRGEYICIKNGVMSAEGSCKAFSYEPTKRIPTVAPVFRSELSDKDFLL